MRFSLFRYTHESCVGRRVEELEVVVREENGRVERKPKLFGEFSFYFGGGHVMSRPFVVGNLRFQLLHMLI
jgi:hypothetical protein